MARFRSVTLDDEDKDLNGQRITLVFDDNGELVETYSQDRVAVMIYEEVKKDYPELF
jgi:hypothetical protein